MNRPPVAQRPQPQQQQRERAQYPAAQPPRGIAKQPDNRGPDNSKQNVVRQPTPDVRQGKPENRAGEERRVTDRANDIRKARADLNVNSRSRLRGAFQFDRARVHNARFDRRVGRHIPRSVRLLAIPAAVIAMFPYYRDYSYFVADDELCIVDPQTYAVVDVVERSYWTSSGGTEQVAGLYLSEQEIALIREGIPPDFPDAGLRLRLALGADIPGGAPLHEFPALLLERVPQLGPYRFLISADQIVIVQPADRSIARVIDRTP